MIPENKLNIQDHLPSQANHPSQGKRIEQLQIITEFLRAQWQNIEQKYQILAQADSSFAQNWLLAKEYINSQNQQQLCSQKYNDTLYSVLGTYNHTIRLNLTREQLLMMQESEHNHVLPAPSPCQYINTKLWTTESQEINLKNWIGHGYYWKRGDGVAKDNYTGDYNCIEEGFVKIANAKVVMADYDLLRADFPQLQAKDNQQINEWLLDQTAYLSSGQVERISSGGDLHDQLDFRQAGTNKFTLDSNQRKTGIRYRGGARAVNFFIDNKYTIENGRFQAQTINVKGAGSQKIMQGFGPKENGLLSLVDAIKQYLFQKLLHKLARIQQQTWGTIQTYAIIDIGLGYKRGLESPATGYIGDQLGLTIRQASSRFESAPDQACFYSVVPYELQGCGNPKKLIQTLVKWGISTQQEPLSVLEQNFNIDNLDGSWNIQSDATLSLFVDFSQFYVLPSSKLPACWRMSSPALLDGIEMNNFAFKRLLCNPSLMQSYFGTDEVEKIQLIRDKDLQRLRQKYGKTAGVMRKPTFSWCWFLEVDDSEIQKFAIKYGLKDGVELDPQFFKAQLDKWLNF